MLTNKSIDDKINELLKTPIEFERMGSVDGVSKGIPGGFRIATRNTGGMSVVPADEFEAYKLGFFTALKYLMLDAIEVKRG